MADAKAQSYSDLWGQYGELWSNTSRLPDFSFAGYHRSEQQPPVVEQVANVKDFGAVGDGEIDDTQAFLDALAKVEKGAIFIPEGRYKVTQILTMNKSGVVLRGAGPSKSVIYCPTSLTDIKPNWGATTNGKATSNYSWSGGMLVVRGSFQSKELAKVTAAAKRGDRFLRVSSTEPFEVGQIVELRLVDDEVKSLTEFLYSGQPGDISNFKGATSSFVTTIVKVGEDFISFDRPLRFDVELTWKPMIRQFEPTVTEVGIEELGFDFPVRDYEGHFSELGFNAITMINVADCWVRNVRISNSDSGLFIGGKFCTLRGLVFDSERKPKHGDTGHHGVILGGTDNVFTDFRFNSRFIHDLGLSANHSGNVFSNGSGVDLNFDHHRRGPYENLFTNIDVGLGTRMWACGGGQKLGLHCGARGTFWNIRSEQPQKYPPAKFGPKSMNLVGVQSEAESVMKLDGKWFEVMDPNQLLPQNLHEAQVERRMIEAFEWPVGKILRPACELKVYPPGPTFSFSTQFRKKFVFSVGDRLVEVVNRESVDGKWFVSSHEFTSSVEIRKILCRTSADVYLCGYDPKTGESVLERWRFTEPKGGYAMQRSVGEMKPIGTAMPFSVTEVGIVGEEWLPPEAREETPAPERTELFRSSEISIFDFFVDPEGRYILIQDDLSAGIFQLVDQELNPVASLVDFPRLPQAISLDAYQRGTEDRVICFYTVGNGALDYMTLHDANNDAHFETVELMPDSHFQSLFNIRGDGLENPPTYHHIR